MSLFAICFVTYWVVGWFVCVWAAIKITLLAQDVSRSDLIIIMFISLCPVMRELVILVVYDNVHPGFFGKAVFKKTR